MEIMNKSLASPVGKLCGVCCLLLAHASGLFAVEVVLQKVPPLTVEQAPAYPENLARYHFGAQVEAIPQSNPIASLVLSSKSEDRNAAEAALLCNDPTVGYALPSGKTTLLVSLPKIENIESLSFLNAGAKGDITVETSNAKLPADSPQWQNAVQQELSSDAVKAKIGPGEAKYVRVTFDVTEPGRIAGFGVYSTPAVSDFTMPRPRKVTVKESSDSFALISNDLTDIHAKARALYVSSGSELKNANHMIDDQPATSFSFAADDAAPVTVIALGKDSTLRRLSAVYAARPGTIEFYVLQSLPAGQTDGTVELNVPGDQPAEEASITPTPENVPKALKLDESAFAAMKSVGSVTDDGTQGRAAIDFPATSGRYVMVRWIPAAQQDGAFSLAEVAAFGDSTTLLAANESGRSEASEGEGESTENGIASDGKTMVDGKDMADGKDMGDAKDMPAEGPAEEAPPAEGPPPSLPDPPPFTFIPVLLPVSP